MVGERASVVAVVGDGASAARAAQSLDAAGPFDVIRLARSADVFGRTYRSAAVAVVADPAAVRGAAVMRRITRIPWLPYLDDGMLRLARRTAGAPFASAAAGLCPPAGLEQARALLPALRVVDIGDADRVRSVIGDVALAEGARDATRRGASAVAADAWTFVNDRATRLAIRLMPVLRKAPAPVHPHHLVEDPGHFWYGGLLRPDDRLLDVGCADGSHTLFAARCVREAVGIDLDATLLHRAEERARRERIANVRFVRGDLADPQVIRQLGLEPVDVVLLLDVLEHLVARVDLLRAIRALLAPGGRLVVSVPNRETPYRVALRRMGGFAYSDPDHKIEYTDELLERELAAAGLEVASAERGGYDSPFGGVTTLLAPFSMRAYARLVRRRRRLGRERPERATALRVVAVGAERATSA